MADDRDEWMHSITFETDRLRVRPWHHAAQQDDVDLADIVARMLTERSTQALPDAWHGNFTVELARTWIDERDAESPTLLVTETNSGEHVGLLIVHAVPLDDARFDLRIGYLLAEDVWGQGFATELVSGLVDWAHVQPRVVSLTGGVDATNNASARVLVKNGFEALTADGNGETIYQLEINHAATMPSAVPKGCGQTGSF